MQTKWTAVEKKQLWIFVAVAFGMPVLMGILMGISFYRGNDVSVFPNAQMYYPAAGVMIAVLLTRKKEEKVPIKFFTGFLVLTAVMAGCAVASLFKPEIQLALISQYIIILGSIVLWLLLWLDKKEVRRKYGLSLGDGQKRRPWLYVLIFLGLYFLRIFLSYLFEGEPGMFFEMFKSISWQTMLCSQVWGL